MGDLSILSPSRFLIFYVEMIVCELLWVTYLYCHLRGFKYYVQCDYIRNTMGDLGILSPNILILCEV